MNLRVLTRGRSFLIAHLLYPPEADQGRVAVVSALDMDWLRQMRSGYWTGLTDPDSMGVVEQRTADAYLNRLFPGMAEMYALRPEPFDDLGE